MPNVPKTWVIALAALALCPALGGAQQPPRRDAKPAQVTIEQQRRLKDAIDKQLAGQTLLAELNENKKAWLEKTPDQLRELRERAYAFRKQDSQTQDAMLDASEQLHKMTPEQREAFRQRAEWLRKVVASLSPQERQELANLPPADRARRLLELKARLVDSQPADSATTQPTSQPASKE